MKKILLSLILVSLSFVSLCGSVYAEKRDVIVTEKIPGANCVCKSDNRDAKDIRAGATEDCGPIEKRKYVCSIDSGLAGFQNMFATIIRWMINIVLLMGVLSIVGLGIAWSIAGGDDAKAKSELKKWAMNIMVGLIILFFFQYILKLLAPWIYI